MMNHSYLIKNAHAILTGLSANAARSSATDIRIQDGKIKEIGQLTQQPHEQVVSAKDCVIYPAWVNTHHHLFQSLLKGEPQGLNQSLTAWLASTPYRFRGAFDEETFRVAVRIGLIELYVQAVQQSPIIIIYIGQKCRLMALRSYLMKQKSWACVLCCVEVVQHSREV